MHIKAGYSLTYDCPQPTPMLLCLNIHRSRRADLLTPQDLKFSHGLKSWDYTDSFGNICTRITARRGAPRFSTESSKSMTPACPITCRTMPPSMISATCPTRCSPSCSARATAKPTSCPTLPGTCSVIRRRAGRASRAILDFAHDRIRFDYQQADRTRSAFDGYTQQVGVCRDFAHLALTLCRCMNIPARYCTGYLGDIGVPRDGEMDFSAGSKSISAATGTPPTPVTTSRASDAS
ncbi:MAG: transglutaminase family protein [Asticcacaulis sp.]